MWLPFGSALTEGKQFMSSKTGSNSGSNSGTSTAGFTLMELLMVVAIIGLLVAVLLPVAGMVRASARTLACFNNLHQIGIASLSWSQDNRGNVVTAWDDTYGNNIRSRWQGMLRPYMFDNEVNVGDRLDATFRCPEVRRDMTWSNDDASTYGKNIWTGQCPAPQNDSRSRGRRQSTNPVGIP